MKPYERRDVHRDHEMCLSSAAALHRAEECPTAGAEVPSSGMGLVGRQPRRYRGLTSALRSAMARKADAVMIRTPTPMARSSGL